MLDVYIHRIGNKYLSRQQAAFSTTKGEKNKAESPWKRLKTWPSQSATRAPAGSKSPKCPLKHLTSLKMLDKRMGIVLFILACCLCLSCVPISLRHLEIQIGKPPQKWKWKEERKGRVRADRPSSHWFQPAFLKSIKHLPMALMRAEQA